MLASPEEWLPLAQLLWERELVTWRPRGAIFSPRGKPVVSGLFGVKKDKKVPGTNLNVLRLICNLVPSNSYFRCLRGEVDELPYIVQWGSFVLLDDEVLLIGQEDMTSAFYLFEMPEVWHEYFAVGKPIRLSDLARNQKEKERIRRKFGPAADEIGHLCVRVLPMGWISAVGVMQSIHRGIMLREPPFGGGLPAQHEIKKTAVLPTSASQRCLGGWQVYLDNFAHGEIARLAALKKLQGEMNVWHKNAQEAWRSWSIPSAADKRVTRSLLAKELGAEIDGWRGAVATTRGRRLLCAGLSLFLMSARRPSRVWTAVAAGRWNYCFQFRKAVSSCFQAIWRLIG